MRKSKPKVRYIFFLSIGVLLLVFAQQASSAAGISVVSTHIVEGENISYGDIVSRTHKDDIFRLSAIRSDKNLFGVIVDNPIILYKRNDTSVPIAETGQVLINVTTINGPIFVGDALTSSSVIGKAQKASEEDAFIVAVALESFSGTDAPAISINNNGEEIKLGQIKATLAIGPSFVEATKEQKESEVDILLGTATVLNVIQYLVAAFVSIGSVFIAFRSFMPNLRDGVISVGRNPRAKSSIKSMVVLNSVLILLVSFAGFLLGIAIILIPI